MCWDIVYSHIAYALFRPKYAEFVAVDLPEFAPAPRDQLPLAGFHGGFVLLELVLLAGKIAVDVSGLKSKHIKPCGYDVCRSLVLLLWTLLIRLGRFRLGFRGF